MEQVSRRTSSALRTTLTGVYRAQLAATGRPNHVAAGKAGNCTRQTAARHYTDSLPGSSTTAPQPAIRDVLAAEAVEAAVGRAAAEQADGAAGAARAELAPVDDSHEAAEQRLVNVARSAAEGLAAHAVGLLSAMTPLVRATRRRLEILASNPDEADARFVIALHGDLAKSLGATVGAIERLASVQSTLSQRPAPPSTVRVERSERLTDEEIKRRADVVVARLRARGLELGSDDSITDVAVVEVSPAQEDGAA
jgi:hypothetical protein